MKEFNDFITWGTLATYSGSLIMVLLLTQFTKGWSYIKKIPTQLWSYILALMVLLPALFFTNQLTFEVFILTFFNAVIISLAANGGFDAIKNMLGKNTQGTIYVKDDSVSPVQLHLDLDREVDKIEDKNVVSFKVRKDE